MVSQSGAVGYTITGKSADLTDVQRMVIDTLHEEGKPQKVNAKDACLLEVQCEVSTVSDDLGCHFICWCWSTVFSEAHSQCSHLPGNFISFHASFCWKALWKCWFHFLAGPGTCTNCQRHEELVHSDSTGYCQEEDERHQTQQCRWPEGNYQSNLSFHYTWAVPLADRLHATPHWCSNSCKRRPSQVSA